MKRKTLLLILVFAVPVLLVMALVVVPVSIIRTPLGTIEAGIDFLVEDQLEWGEFETLTCEDVELTEDCDFDSSPFVTSMVVYSIKDIIHPAVKTITGKVIKFFLSEQQPNGAWNVYTSKREGEKEEVPPDDADDTACVSAFLAMKKIDFRDNMALFNQFRSERGAVNLWFHQRFAFLKDYDCEVNANVLFYFAVKGIKDQRVCDFVNDQIRNKNYRCCHYCVEDEEDERQKNVAFLFYMISRAYRHGALCLEKVKKQIIYHSLSRQQPDGSFGNELDTAFYINTLLNYGYRGVALKKGVENLLDNQRWDGSWPGYGFYIDFTPYYLGCDSGTTAIALEAIDRYLKLAK